LKRRLPTEGAAALTTCPDFGAEGPVNASPPIGFDDVAIELRSAGDRVPGCLGGRIRERRLQNRAVQHGGSLGMTQATALETMDREDVRLVVVEDHEDTRIALQQQLELDGPASLGSRPGTSKAVPRC